MAFQQSDLDTIRAAIAGGVQRVRFADGREIYYQTLDSLMQAEQRIAAALSTAAGGRRIHTPGYRNGF